MISSDGGDEDPGVDRRRFLQVGGVTLVWSAVLAACSRTSRHPGHPTITGVGTTTTTTAGSADAGLLRLASSIEHAAVQVYMTAAGSGLVKTAALLDNIRYFADQHADHAGFWESRTGAVGAQPFTTANQVIMNSLQPRIAGLATEAEVVKLAYDIEVMAAATYYSAVGTFHDMTFNASAMAVGGTEGRHLAALGLILSGLPGASGSTLTTVARRTDSPPYPPGAFQTRDGAIAPGTGV
jgi:hypothetical protein